MPSIRLAFTKRIGGEDPLGAEIEVHPDGLTVRPPESVRPAVLDPRGDHRMAMALSLVGLAAEGIAIREEIDPDAVKQYCDYRRAAGLLPPSPG